MAVARATREIGDSAPSLFRHGVLAAFFNRLGPFWFSGLGNGTGMVRSVLTTVPPLASQPTARKETKVAMPSTRRRFLQQVSLAAVAFTPLAARGPAAAAGAQSQDDDVPYVIAQPCIGAKDAACLT